MATEAAALPTGYVLRNYRIRKFISRGGFGVTYLAEDLDDDAPSRPWGRPDRLVAIKEFLPLQGAVRLDNADVEPADDSRETTEAFTWGFEKFASEARLLARVSSKRAPGAPTKPVANFAQVGPFFEENNTAYIVMEYIGGGSLRTQLDRAPPQTETTLKPLLRQLIDALALVHEDGVWHRDIKPQNILLRVPAGVEEPSPLLTERDRNRVLPVLLGRPDVCPVLIDFGAARTSPTREGFSMSVVGTEGYAPAEQFDGGQVGPWSDIYAVSAVAYRALLGRTPTTAQTRQTAFMKTGFDPLEPAQRAAKASGSANFLMALDWGLWIESDLRPQTLAEWRPVLLDGKPASQAVADQFLIEPPGEQDDGDGQGEATELPIVEEATGDTHADPPILKPDPVLDDTQKQRIDPLKPKPKPPVPWTRIAAGALGGVAALSVALYLTRPKPPKPIVNDGPVPIERTTEAPEEKVLVQQTLTGPDWVTADISQQLAGSTPRWISLESDAPIRVRAGGKVYLVEGDGVRLPDLSGGAIEVKPVNPSAGPAHFAIRAGQAPAP